MTKGSARVLVFYASASVLVLEILAGRLMAPYVGVTLESFTAIIGTILAGIALGNAVGGRLADRYDPRVLLGPVLVVGGALAWLSLPIVSGIGSSLGSDPIAIVVLAAMAFFLPAAVLSTVTPLVTKLRLESLDDTGTVVGNLSAAGTAGALVGTFATGFVLVSAIPTRPIVMGVGGALALVGAVLSLRLGRRPPGIAVVTLLVVSLVAGAVADDPCEFESVYYCGRVVEDPDDASRRVLILDTLRHAAVDLDDPTHLEFRYVRLLADVIDATTDGSIDALHIGGGGFTLPAWVRATRPGSTNLVLEIDDDLVDVARDELGLVTGTGLEVQTGDARLAFDDLADDSFDVVVGDAFGGPSVPWHLTTTEVIAEIHRVLRPGGVYVMNVIDGGANRFVEWELRTLQEHFAHTGAIVPVDGVGPGAVNQVLFGSDEPVGPIDIAGDDGTRVDDVAAFAEGGRVLRDDFAPVDQLTEDF